MRMKLSTTDCPTACLFSPIAFSRESLITITGNGTAPASSPRRRSPPEVVSSVPPMRVAAVPRATMPAARSAPLSSRMSGAASRTGGHVRVVLLERVVAGAEHGHAGGAQVRHDVVLRRAVVAGRDDLGSAGREGLEQHRGLGLEVQRHADAAALEGTRGGERRRGCRRAGACGSGSSRRGRRRGPRDRVSVVVVLMLGIVSHMKVVFIYAIRLGSRHAPQDHPRLRSRPRRRGRAAARPRQPRDRPGRRHDRHGQRDDRAHDLQRALHRAGRGHHRRAVRARAPRGRWSGRSRRPRASTASRGSTARPCPSRRIELDPRPAAQFIIDTIMAAEPGEITLVPTGALTNIALAARLEPRIVPRVREVVLMGGGAHVGNWSAVARVQHRDRPGGGIHRLRRVVAGDHDRPRPHPPGARDPGCRGRHRRGRHRPGALRPRAHGVLRPQLQGRAGLRPPARARPVRRRLRHRPDADAHRARADLDRAHRRATRSG